MSMKKMGREALLCLCFTFEMSYCESFIIEFFFDKYNFC